MTQVVNARLARYLAGASTRFNLGWAVEQGQRMTLDRATLEHLPTTAVTAIGSMPWRLPVEATCRTRVAVTDDLTLYAYQVAAPGPDVESPPLEVGSLQVTSQLGATPGQTGVDGMPTGARAAILEAIDQLATTSGSDTVTITDVLGYLRRNKELVVIDSDEHLIFTESLDVVLPVLVPKLRAVTTDPASPAARGRVSTMR